MNIEHEMKTQCGLRMGLMGEMFPVSVEIPGGYFVFCHPDAERDLRTLKARNDWQRKYRYYRIQRRHVKETYALDHYLELPARRIMEIVTPAELQGEAGMVQGFRILESA
jgi:hypothetical protein